MVIDSSESDKRELILVSFAIVIQENSIPKVLKRHSRSGVRPKDISYRMALDKLHGVKECRVFSLHAFDIIQNYSSSISNTIPNIVGNQLSYAGLWNRRRKRRRRRLNREKHTTIPANSIGTLLPTL